MASRPGQAGSFLFYATVLLVAASSVAFGLDWMQAPLPPMPETEASVQAAKLAAHLPPPRAVVVARSAPRSVYPARPAPQSGGAIAAADATDKEQGAATPNIVAPEPAAAQTPAASEQPKCDVAACSAAYHSFRASDCTWQPFDGPRRFCDKGNPPQEAALAPEQAVDPAQFSDKCDIETCRRAYFTFDPTDCTYQPSNGPRRLCTKGTPPKPKSAEAPAGAPPANAPASAATPPTAVAPAATAPVSNMCDVDACKRAYFTFNPADCTYQPSDGPRRLCTKGTPPKPEATAEPAAAPVPPPPAAPAQAPPPAAAAVPAAPAAPAAPTPPTNAPAKQEAAAPATATPPAATSPPAAPVAPAPAPTAPEAVVAPAAPSAPVSDKCDVEACKRAYFTFNPADCTYQPSDGPRRLCTKGASPKPQAAAPAGTRAPRAAAPDHPVPPGLVPSAR